MNLRTNAVILLLMLATASCASASDMRPMGAYLVSTVCTLQSPDSEKSMLDRSEGANSGSSGPGELHKRSLARCLRERQWVPPALCASVKQLNLEDGKQLSSWFTENEDAIQTLEPVFSYVFGAMDGRADDGTCPEIPVGGARK